MVILLQALFYHFAIFTILVEPTTFVVFQIANHLKVITEIRRENLHRLIKEKFPNQQLVLANMLGYENASVISQWLHKKSMGDKAARKIEKVCGLERGWMDHEHGVEDLLIETLMTRDQIDVERALGLLKIPWPIQKTK